MTLFLQAKDKLLNIGFGFDKPPYTFSKNSSSGIEPELVKAILEPLGYKINVIQMNKYYLENILYKKNIYDGVSSVSRREGDKICYSDNFIYYENFAVTRKKDHIKIDSLSDLTKYNFVAWNGSYNDLGGRFFELFNPNNGLFKEKYHENPSQIDDVKSFFSKKVDAILIDKKIFLWYKNYFQVDEEFEFHPIFPKRIWFTTAFRSKKICKEFNQGLKRIVDNGTYKKIIEYHIHHNLQPLLQLADALADILAPYLYHLDKKTAKALLKIFIRNSDITSIKIIDTKLNKIFIEIKNSKVSTPQREMQRDIIYKTETGEVKLGKLIIKYKNNFNGNDIIPPIEAFYDTANIDINRIYQAYKRYRIICSKRVPLTEKERAYLKSIKFINVHNEADWPPFNFNEDGEPKGFSIDFMKLIGRKLNLKINFVSGYSWDQFLQLIKNNRIDVIANIMDIPQRREYINFTIPYLTTKKAIFSNQPNLNYFSDLEGKIVAVPKGFYIEEYLKERYPKIKIKRYKNVLECIVAVLNKEADALVESYSVVNYLLQKNNLNIKYMTISKDKELSSKLSLGVTKSKPILRDILNKAIESITREEFDELKKKWADIKEQKLSILTSEENRYLKSLGYIRVCTSSNQKVTENIKDKNIASGIAIDILKIISDKIDLKMKFIYPKSLKELLEFLKNGDCDLAPGLVYTKERAKYLWFTKPYISYKLALITRDDRPIVTDMYTISDKTMARKEGSALISLMRERYPKLKIIETDSYEEAFSLVKDGKAYFTIATLPILSSYKYQYGLDNLKIAGYLDMRYPFSFAINKDNYLLYSIIEKTLSSIPKKTFQIVSDKWTIFNIVEKTDYIFALKVVIAFSIIIFLLLYAYLKLKRLHNKIHHLNQGLERRVKEEIEKNRTKEKMLLHQDRLAKMGEILSMIAHQWRQPLNNLSIINQILVIKYNRGELNQHVIDKFKRDSSKQITLMSKTIDDFKNFFKPEKDKQVFNIGELLNEMIDMLKPVIQSSDIKIDLDIDESIEISGYRNELGQSLLNIINNAKDALVANKKSNRKIEIKIKREAKKVVISVADNAGGIPENILDKICEPYFSTKSNKNGTGLGLYMSRIIIEDYMRGELKISNRDEGALFEIILESTT